MSDEPIRLDMDEILAFIQERLIARGVTVSNEAVALVLDAEMEYMEAKGLVEPADDQSEKEK